MKLICTLVSAAAVGLLAVGTASSSQSMALPKVTGTVGPGFTISLKQNGKVVKTLKAGMYTLVVTDKASIHNFQIEGKGLDKAVTTPGFVGTKTVTVRLRAGKVKYYCAPHESSMFGFVKVTA